MKRAFAAVVGFWAGVLVVAGLATASLSTDSHQHIEVQPDEIQSKVKVDVDVQVDEATPEQTTVRSDGRETRTVEAFEDIVVKGGFDVILQKGNSYTVELTGDNLDEIKTYVKDDALIIEPTDDNDWGWNGGNDYDDVTVVITYQELERVTLAGSANLTAKETVASNELEFIIAGSGNFELDLDCSVLAATIAGSGEFNLTGETEKLKLSIAGSGEANLKNLAVGDASVSIAGSGDANVQCTGLLDVNIAGSGNVTYYGEPSSTNLKSMGSGSMRRGRSD